MDLPIELRLQIAEYALSKETPLTWIWGFFDPTSKKKLGTFDGLQELTSLARVSRQLHSELSGYVWRLNEFSFHAKPYVGDSNGSRRRNVRLMHVYFVRNFPTTHLGDLRLITLNMNATKDSWTKSVFLQSLPSLARGTPNARVRIWLDDWNIYDKRLIGAYSSDVPSGAIDLKIDKFMSQGREWEHLLSAPGLEATKRNWRIYPGQYNDFSMLKDHLERANLQVALEWRDKGV
jgi:hypothetical protein